MGYFRHGDIQEDQAIFAGIQQPQQFVAVAAHGGRDRTGAGAVGTVLSSIQNLRKMRPHV